MKRIRKTAILLVGTAFFFAHLGDARAQIKVVAGTYGKTCGQPRGNKTSFLRAACDGKNTCRYTIDYKKIGDPAVGCSKDYIAEWRCGGSSRIHSVRATPEAGFRKVVVLRCGGGSGGGSGGGRSGASHWPHTSGIPLRLCCGC